MRCDFNKDCFDGSDEFDCQSKELMNRFKLIQLCFISAISLQSFVVSMNSNASSMADAFTNH